MVERAGVTIREASIWDAEGLVTLDEALAADGRGMVLDLDQVLGVEERRRQIDETYRAAAAGSANVVLVADAGSIVGCAELRQLRPARCRHVAVLSLGVHPGHQRRGVGRALMQALIDHAASAGIERLELYMRADNDRAHALYRSLGFVCEGSRERFVRLGDGTYVDDWIMVRFLRAP